MILFDRKRALNLILGPSPKDQQVEAEDPIHTLAKEALAAAKADDYKGFAEATKAMFLAYNDAPPVDGSMDAVGAIE